MGTTINRHVRQRADDRCEYCQVPQFVDMLTFEVDHIIARKHGGLNAADNLCLSCFYCNSFKGTDIASLDPKTGRLAALYHPRRQRWARHFRWEYATLIGMTAVGRVTVFLLQINDPIRVSFRQDLINEGLFP